MIKIHQCCKVKIKFWHVPASEVGDKSQCSMYEPVTWDLSTANWREIDACMGDNSVKIVCLLFENGSTLKGKNLLHWEQILSF